MLKAIEDRFALLGRTPKGRRAMRAIFKSTYQTVSEDGLEASLEQIADRAQMTQAALRHYFTTREELLTTFFVVASEWLRSQLAQILATDSMPAKAKLEQCLARHLEYMEGVNTTVWLEASAFWIRMRSQRRTRDDWYRWLAAQYAELIGQIQPALSRSERQHRAYVLLTLVLGAWITHGRASAWDTSMEPRQQRQLLVNAANEIVLS
jgi:AcrR family transcriptional regulator